MEGQQALELILARNLLSSISTPAFLVDADGVLVFFNEAAGTLLGRRFEESGKLTAEEWGRAFGPFDQSGQPIPFERLPLTIALREGRPAHASHCIHSSGGEQHDIEVSALPLVSTDGGFRGALAIFWPTQERGA
ncbi:MAG: PAS domain-containing protein [Actinomycetota bacterium]|nr:PAS domain-containing protein [Actinomycetota bacterium]